MDIGQPLTHIIILTWNRWETTRACLHSLQALDYDNFHIVVVDNASQDETVARLRVEFPGVTLLCNTRNLGFAAGVNVGIRHALAAGAEYVLLLNNDTLVPPDLLATMLRAAAELPDAGMLTPMLRYMDQPAAPADTLWFSGARRHPLTLESREFGPLGPRAQQVPQARSRVDYIFGTAMLLPSTVLREVGLFDERFFLYYEDMDLCLRVQRAGYHLYVLPEVSVQHGIATSTQGQEAMRLYHKARASVQFFRKHAVGPRRLIIIPYRLASALRTTLRHARGREWASVRAYWRGLWDGLRAP